MNDRHRPFDPATAGLAMLTMIAMLALSGCVAVGGTRSSTAVQPTTGQQLIDLKRALDCGAISETEFEHQKSRLLSGCST